MVADAGGLPLRRVASCGPARLKEVVDEHDAMADEALVADGDQFADEGMRLDARVRSDGDVSLDFDERPDECVVAQLAPVEVDGLYQSDVFAEGNVFDLSGMNNGMVGHTVGL